MDCDPSDQRRKFRMHERFAAQNVVYQDTQFIQSVDALL